MENFFVRGVPKFRRTEDFGKFSKNVIVKFENTVIHYIQFVLFWHHIGFLGNTGCGTYEVIQIVGRKLIYV